MKKEELKRKYLVLAEAVEGVENVLRLAREFDIPYSAFGVMTNGEPFEVIKTVGFSERLRTTALVGKLTKRESPNDGGVYLSVDTIKNFANMMQNMVNMPYEEVKEEIPNYEEFVPLAETLKVASEMVVDGCVKLIDMIEAYISEATEEPFKENWKVFKSDLEGIGQTLRAYMKSYEEKHYIFEDEVNLSLKSSDALAETLGELGVAYENETVTAKQVEEVLLLLDETLTLHSKALEVIVKSGVGHEFIGTYEQFGSTLNNMKRFSGDR